MVYAQMDGGMILTDDDWREVKVGRLFRENDCQISGSEKQNGSIRESQYSAYLGNYQEFMNRFGRIISPCGHLGERLVFLSDGALWIKNWISEHYPQAVQILDFYHVKEHLAEFAELVYPDAAKRRKWLEVQADRLLEGDFQAVIQSMVRKEFWAEVQWQAMHFIGFDTFCKVREFSRPAKNSNFRG